MSETIETTIIEGATALMETTYSAAKLPAPQTPAERVAMGTAIANQISDMIEKQNMYSMIQGKKYVKVDAWVGLGSMDGVFPRERDVLCHEDGSYEAYVELIDKNTGRVIGGASAICGVDEKRWGGAEKYARRSMAITRATGKAFRLHYSWVMCLAGYEPTPFEEMPEHLTTPKPTAAVYTGTNEQKERLIAYCTKEGLETAETDGVLARMVNRPLADAFPIVAEIKKK